ncbi:MAG: porphobilinogen synthase [Actinomycetaceae bacterium]|nr:porphobilinogen synthase [Actinomycetaceae bacterium]
MNFISQPTSKDLAPHLHPLYRPRRLRLTPAIRSMVSETSWRPEQLIYPVFVREGINEPQEISSLPGQYQHTLESVVDIARKARDLHVGGLMIFGVPRDEDKDDYGRYAWSDACIANKAIESIRSELGNDIVIMADTCLDEYTSHGHCGPLDENGDVDNDAALVCYQQAALAQAKAGAHFIAPSGMMDGQIQALRDALDTHGYENIGIFAYSSKFASAFFGPFRDAVGCELQGDRRSYQEDPANKREAIHETLLDIEEGADMVMVKPASYYGDILAQIAEFSPVPVGAYQVSGEYAMVAAAAERGWIDKKRTVDEQLICLVRGGADVILTYWALEAAEWKAKKL